MLIFYCFIFFSLTTYTVGQLGIPCSFNTNCTCYNNTLEANKYEALCDTESLDFPYFTPLPEDSKITIDLIQVEGQYTNIPNFAFANLYPKEIILTRNGNKSLPLSIADQAFVPMDNNKTSFDAIAFISFKGLAQIPKQALANIIHIADLSFYNCGIQILVDNSFNGVNVTNVTIYQCSLEAIQSQAFNEINGLLNLFLDNNVLTEIPTNIYGGIDLQTLSLDSNRITKIPDNAFTSYPNLLSLNLNNNSIQDNISDTAFNGLNKLYELQLGSLGMTKIPTTALRTLASSLKSFHFDNNKVAFIDNNTFANFTSLSNLYFDFNPILDIMPGAFYGDKNLETLTLENLPNLTTVDISITYGTNIVFIENLLCPKVDYLEARNPYMVANTLTIIDANNIELINPNINNWLRGNQSRKLLLSGDMLQCQNDFEWMAEYALCPPYQIISTARCYNGPLFDSYLKSTYGAVCKNGLKLTSSFSLLYSLTIAAFLKFLF